MSIPDRNQLASKKGAPHILVTVIHGTSWVLSFPFCEGPG